MWYRVTVDGIGIYAAVERDCPKDDLRRQHKPDGALLPRVGVHYPGAYSYWTEYGWQWYNNSGLFAWHSSVVNGSVHIEYVENKPSRILYEDAYQIIA